HTSAAPLKPGCTLPYGHGRQCSPHSHECGPVEAVMARDPLAEQRISPHSHECGPVEAMLTQQRWSLRSTLRTHTSAAPLKLPSLAAHLGVRRLSALTRVRPR